MMASGSQKMNPPKADELDFRVYDKPRDDLTKNDHFRAMLERAKERGFEPRYILFDS
jgi:putative transposase